MPQLYVFAACEKVIIDQTGIATLVSLFNRLTVVPEQDIPGNAVIPKEWAIFTSWNWEPEDEGREYTQAIQISYPDGSPFLGRLEYPFVMQANLKQQINIPVMGFPIGQAGVYTIRMQLEYNRAAIFEATPIHLEVTRQPIPGAAGQVPAVPPAVQ